MKGPPRLLMLTTPELQGPSPSADRRGFVQNYVPGSVVDEMLEADGALRAHWQTFVSQLDDLGPESATGAGNRPGG